MEDWGKISEPVYIARAVHQQNSGALFVLSMHAVYVVCEG